MVDVIQNDQRGAYADFDSRALSRDPQRKAVSNLPIIDLSPFMEESAREDRIHAARTIRSACIDIGFFYVRGHGFAVNELNAVLAQGLKFFALPLEKKMTVLSSDVNMPGFVRIGGMDPERNRDNVVDIKERL
jgi:isopenicillin N synthase-like dioxygenase